MGSPVGNPVEYVVQGAIAGIIGLKILEKSNFWRQPILSASRIYIKISFTLSKIWAQTVSAGFRPFFDFGQFPISVSDSFRYRSRAVSDIGLGQFPISVSGSFWYKSDFQLSKSAGLLTSCNISRLVS